MKYQVFLSFGSIIITNPRTKFNFFFILPPGEAIDLTPFNKIINKGSTINIRHYKSNHAYHVSYITDECEWPSIIVVKLYLYEILPEIDKVLYLDTDIMCISRIDQLWDLDISNKNFAAVTKFEADSFYWINSGVILYNLNELRKKNDDLWICAQKETCFVDDEWHTFCHEKKSVFPLPLRFNIEMLYIIKKSKTLLHKIEKKNIVLVHLKDKSHEFYNITNRNDIPHMNVVEGNKLAISTMKKLFAIKEKIENDVHFSLLKN